MAIFQVGVVALVALVLAQCGGREARPVDARRALDAQLSCDHMKAEIEVNEARMEDLAAEAKASSDQNVGLLIVSPLFLDLSDVERQEIEALISRNRILEEERRRRDCPVGQAAID